MVEAPAPDAPPALMPPRPNFHDFGRVPDGQVATHVFRYRNVSARPIAVLRVVPSCGCAVPTLRSVAPDGTVVVGPPITAAPPLLSVPPQGVLELKLSIDTSAVTQKNVDRLYTIRIESDAEASFYLSLEAHIFVERAFEIAPPFMSLGRVPESVGGQGAVSIAQGVGFAWEVQEVVESPPGLTTWIIYDEPQGRRVWEIAGRLDPPLARGTYQGRLRVVTADPQGHPGPELTIAVQGEVVGDLESAPARFVFAAGRGERAEMAGVLRSLVPGQRFTLTSGEFEAQHATYLELAFDPVAPDGQGKSGEWNLRVATLPPLPADEILRGELVLTTDDPAYPEFRLPYVVHLR
jgi:hypothetical protein